eukprot:TRINITY_DN13209_c0_g1_i1.p1 TRINITY_DN13209_c0_g1~~TRINITY_DN13209_c0_g1_i1.p1  ORF type:complete len:209 (-),score=27.23 TRINITY_DN13209_c0_g1_i1:156-782(-)
MMVSYHECVSMRGAWKIPHPREKVCNDVMQSVSKLGSWTMKTRWRYNSLLFARVSSHGVVDDVTVELESMADGSTLLRFDSTNGDCLYDWLQYRRNSRELYSQLRRRSRVNIEEEGEKRDIPGHFLKELMRRLRDPKSGLQLQEKMFLLMKFQDCFSGSELVTWLMEELDVDREHASDLGSYLLECKLIGHLSSDYIPFTEVCFYHFL